MLQDSPSIAHIFPYICLLSSTLPWGIRGSSPRQPRFPLHQEASEIIPDSGLTCCIDAHPSSRCLELPWRFSPYQTTSQNTGAACTARCPHTWTASCLYNLQELRTAIHTYASSVSRAHTLDRRRQPTPRSTLPQTTESAFLAVSAGLPHPTSSRTRGTSVPRIVRWTPNSC